MPLNIRSIAVDRLAALAEKRGLTKTEAVRQALVETIEREPQHSPFRERLKVIQERIAGYPSTGLKADKTFFDSLNDE